MPRIHYASEIVYFCNNIDVTKRDISHFDARSNRRMAVAVFVYAFFLADGNGRFAPVESCGNNALPCYTRVTQYSFYIVSGFADLDEIVYRHTAPH